MISFKLKENHPCSPPMEVCLANRIGRIPYIKQNMTHPLLPHPSMNYPDPSVMDITCGNTLITNIYPDPCHAHFMPRPSIIQVTPHPLWLYYNSLESSWYRLEPVTARSTTCNTATHYLELWSRDSRHCHPKV